ncbi:extracellular solute-binding protein [Alkalicoccus urumqiensis]|uniref:Sugar ABC transporter substrate-binding protein n=1 Tax=Alkalicoccus urumqiensis TaxID=1548213 RepID=A0A2P6ML60_ALKUR|nr:extracellular solute-binding protein [Alkalicoccus urumqiensis]PRO67009.1 sugar ABC transporter substrate-binding protein [Alkalicoccus urumqiensis]
MKAWKTMVAGAMSVSVLAACGGGDDGNEAASGNNNGGNTNETAENNSGNSNEGNSGNNGGGEGDVSGDITIWGWNVAAASMELAVEGFQEQYPDVNVTVEDIGREDVYDRLTVGLAAGGSGLPDVTLVETDRLDNYAAEFPDGFVNLSEHGFDEHEDKFVDSKVEAMKNDDGDFIYAPWDIGPAAVFYHVPTFEEAGVDPESIETWDDYMDAGEEILSATDSQMVPVDIAADDALFRMMLNQQGAYYFDEEGNIDLTSDEAVQAMSAIQEMEDRGLVQNTDGWDGTVTATVNQTVATVPFGVWYSGTIMDQAPDQSGDWGVFKLPAFEEGGNRNANLGGSDLAALSSSDNPEAAVAFVEYFTTDEEAQVAALDEYGIFPSLTEAYENEFFAEEDEFFNNQPIWEMFAEISEGIPAANYTSDYARAFRYSSDAQADALLQDTDVAEALQTAAEQLANETGREIN